MKDSVHLTESAGEAATAAGQHYTVGRRWSHISNAWILLESWNDREEIASLRARIKELESLPSVPGSVDTDSPRSDEKDSQ